MNPLVASILANPAKHQVNRKAKLEASADVAVESIIKLREEREIASNQRQAELTNEHFGYGTNKKQGD
jgi:hypothetical protein